MVSEWKDIISKSGSTSTVIIVPVWVTRTTLYALEQGEPSLKWRHRASSNPKQPY